VSEPPNVGLSVSHTALTVVRGLAGPFIRSREMSGEDAQLQAAFQVHYRR